MLFTNNACEERINASSSVTESPIGQQTRIRGVPCCSPWHLRRKSTHQDQLSHFPSSMKTASITQGSLEAVSTVFMAWRRSSTELADESDETARLLLHGDDMPEPLSARNQWDLLSSDEKKRGDSSLKHNIMRLPSSLMDEIPLAALPRRISAPANRRKRRTRPLCLFVNYLGTRPLPQPKPPLPPLSAEVTSKFQHKEPTSTPTAAPTTNILPTTIVATPNLTKVLRTSPKAAPFPLMMPLAPSWKRPYARKRKNTQQHDPFAFNIKVPIHLTNLKLPGAVVQAVKNKKKKSAYSSNKSALV
jgi:hypothetical protein